MAPHLLLCPNVAMHAGTVRDLHRGMLGKSQNSKARCSCGEKNTPKFLRNKKPQNSKELQNAQMHPSTFPQQPSWNYFLLEERESKRNISSPLFIYLTPVASLSCIPACWMTGAWQESGLCGYQWRRFMFTLQHRRWYWWSQQRSPALLFRGTAIAALEAVSLGLTSVSLAHPPQAQETWWKNGGLVPKAGVPTAWAPWSSTDAFSGWMALGATLCVWFSRISNPSQTGM